MRPLHRVAATLVAPLLGALALGGCSTIHVATDYDRAYDFSQVRTYSWARSKGGESNLAFLDRRVKRAVDAELAARGYARRDSGGDCLVVYSAKVRDRKQVTVHRSYWNRWRSVDRYKEGSLVLGVVDRARDEIIWTGWAEGIVSDTGQSEEQIREAVAKILEDFPPGE